MDAAAYAPLIRRAAKLIELRSLAEAQKVLGQCAEGRRGWEWQYLSQQCKPGAKATFDVPLMTRTGDPENPTEDDKMTRFRPLAATFMTAPDIKNRVTGKYLYVLAGDAAGLGRFPVRSDRGEYNNNKWIMLPWPIPTPAGSGFPDAGLRWLATDHDGDRYVRQYDYVCVVNGWRLAGSYKRADFPPGDRTVLRTAAGDLIEFRGDKPDTTRPAPLKDRDGKLGRVKSAAGYTFSDDCAWLATTGGDLFAIDWTGPEPVLQDHSEPLQAALKPKDGEPPPVLQSVAVGPGGKQVVFSDAKGRMLVYTRGGTPEPLQQLTGAWPAAPVVRFSRDGRRIAFVSGTTGTIHVVEADTAEILVTVNNGGARVLDFRFGDTDPKLMAGTIGGNDQPMMAGTTGGNDQELMTVTADGTARFWLTIGPPLLPGK